MPLIFGKSQTIRNCPTQGILRYEAPQNFMLGPKGMYFELNEICAEGKTAHCRGVFDSSKDSTFCLSMLEVSYQGWP